MNDEKIRAEIVDRIYADISDLIRHAGERAYYAFYGAKSIKFTMRESEDERMLNKIISYLEMIKMGCVICTIDTSEEIAWLGKQKEQKHYWKPTETDVALFNKAVTTNKALTPAERAQLDIIRSKFSCCHAVTCSGTMQKEQKPYQEVLSDSENRMLDYHASLVRGEERKPFAHENDFVSKSKGYIENAAHNYAMNFGDKESELYIEIFDAYKAGAYYAELRQKRAEWSEEDMDYYDTIVCKLEVIGDDSGLSNNQIKFLREHCPSRRSEWSEEDGDIEKAIESVIRVYGKTQGEFIAGYDMDTLIFHLRAVFRRNNSWNDKDKNAIVDILRGLHKGILYKEAEEIADDILKSLRPSWKPSEEQMRALSETIAFMPDTFKPKCTLVTLQDDLKKQM